MEYPVACIGPLWLARPSWASLGCQPRANDPSASDPDRCSCKPSSDLDLETGTTLREKSSSCGESKQACSAHEVQSEVTMEKRPAASSTSTRSASKRLLKELENWKAEAREETGIERLGPQGDDDILNWEAVINGRGIPGGYEEGRWLLSIQIPQAYPHAPPTIRFVTPIIHANIALQTGEICLDLLKEAWTPAYSVLECVRAVRMLLSTPETDSPLNVDVASLMRGGDAVGTQALVEYWIKSGEGKYRGK